ncbi:MAG: T9SS C-terminal target domain-containing protein [Calditrichaeota bacterium]|nr:MAG: T9SS C-terminal target domain-containing protein [Calditrichota bacterium]
MKKTIKFILISSAFGAFASNSFAQKIYWTDTNSDKIQRADLDGSNVEDLVSTGLMSPEGLALDLNSSKMYWVDFGTNKIQRANLDGSNVEDLISTGLVDPFDLALDLNNSKMYWVDAGTNKMQRANLDGSNVEDLITSLIYPYGITLDLVNSKVYWTDAAQARVYRANLDGSNIEIIIPGGSFLNPKGIALDLINSKLYFTDQGDPRVVRSNLDGSNIEVIFTDTELSENSHPQEIVLDIANSKFYFALSGTDKISKANFDGTSLEDVIIGIPAPRSLALSISDNPLSVELSYFNAHQIGNSIQLNWATGSEKDNAGFNIYRKFADNDFFKISSFRTNISLIGQGNTSFDTQYKFTDYSNFNNSEIYTYLIADVDAKGAETIHKEISQSVLFELKTQKVNRFALEQNYPNPFNPKTTISYQLEKDSEVNLKIYNEKGNFVKSLSNGFQKQGSYKVIWDGTDNNGNQVSNGTYFYKLITETFSQSNKMILLK